MILWTYDFAQFTGNRYCNSISMDFVGSDSQLRQGLEAWDEPIRPWEMH